ncbi:uncharacterized protein LOC135682802 [Rhopilema esculentum]|uniref:uncharacterized protein LOC135682802 n=1 Tax=Rhopilema esculentum TaxID=499914 RepID=UPI0031DD9693
MMTKSIFARNLEAKKKEVLTLQQKNSKCILNATESITSQSTTRITSRKPTNTDVVTDDNTVPDSSTTNFPSVCDFINAHVIAGNQFASLKVLTEIYGFNKDDCRLRGKVKERLQKEFGDQITFVRVSYHEAEIVISSKALLTTNFAQFTKESKEFILKEAAKIIRDDILAVIENALELPWPPTPDSLSKQDRQPPRSVQDFILRVIHATHHSPGDDVKRYVDSYSQDLVHAVSKGSFLTQKHVLVGAGLHSLTGQKTPIKILARLGHCCNYDKVRLIETAQAEVVQKLRSIKYPLPLQPANSDMSVLTYFWWDNFDVQKENVPGSLHTTHGIAFQVESPGCIKTLTNVETEKTQRRTVKCNPLALPQRKIVSHTEPVLFEAIANDEFDGRYHCKLLFLWKLMRRIFYQSPQCISRFVGWVVLVFGKPESRATTLTFLPPIAKPITDYSTVIECIKQSQSLSAASNMKYTHITVDAGAAMKFYHVLWNNPDEFNDVFIHLGDFHASMEFFGTIGKFVTGSGFEEIVYQAGMCTSGGIKGAISGKHYNRSWLVNECVAEAIDRLFCAEYMPDIPDEVERSLNQKVEKLDVTSILDEETFTAFSSRYKYLKEKCIAGDFGKTPQFWMIYQAAVDRQHQLHLSANINDFCLRLKCWKESLPLCFAMNKQNYSRYGAYYCKSLEHIEHTHPGAKEELEEKGLSVCRNGYGIGQSIDGAGEQTFMRSSKTIGIEKYLQLIKNVL